MFTVFWSDHVLLPIHAGEETTIAIAVEAGLDVLSILIVLVTVSLGTDYVIDLRSQDGGGEGEKKEEEQLFVTETKKDK